MNIGNPITKFMISDMHFLVDPIKAVYKNADIYLNEMQIDTKSDYFPQFSSSSNSLKTFTYNQEFREQISFDNNINKYNIGDFYFRKSKTKFLYERNLGDLWSIVSGLAGAWSSCYVCFMFAIRNYNKNYFINSLANKLYNYPSQKKKKQKMKTLEKEENKNKTQAPQNDIEENDEKNIYQKIIKKIETYLSYENKLKVSFCFMWRFLFENIFWFLPIHRNEKSLLIEKTKLNLWRDLDICNILKKLQEFDKIKSLLFSHDQQVVLSFTPKPEISKVDSELSRKRRMTHKSFVRLQANRNRGRFLLEQMKYDKILPYKNLILAWRALKTNENNSENISINESLIRMFGEEFSDVIDVTEDDLKFFLEKPKATIGIKLKNALKNFKKSSFMIEKRGGFSVGESVASPIHFKPGLKKKVQIEHKECTYICF